MAVTPDVGQVEALELEAFGTPPGSAKRSLILRDDLFADEVVETVEDGFLHVRFHDQTELRIGSGSSVKLDQFVFDPSSRAGELVLNLGAGVFRLITGEINPVGIKIVTPSATVGIRGTDLILQVLASGGILLLLLSGIAFVRPLLGEDGVIVRGANATLAVGPDGAITENVPIPPLELLFGLVTDLEELFPQPEAGGEEQGAALVPPGGAAFNAFSASALGTPPGGDGAFAALDDRLVQDALRVIADLLQATATGDAGTTLLSVLVLGAATAPIVAVAPALAGAATTAAATAPATVIIGTEGDDLLIGTDDDDSLFGLGGDDTLFGGAGGGDTLYGGPGGDTLYGEADGDTLYGGAGGDALGGDDGDDTLFGSDGADTLYGDAGGDSLHGEADGDLLYGGAGGDALRGGGGGDSLYGEADGDTLFGASGADSLYGDAGADSLYGELGDDLLFGGADGDTLYGAQGGDSLSGGAGGDTLYGNDGSDSLLGDGGSDLLFGGTEPDSLAGGPGGDIFAFALGDGGADLVLADVVTDFADLADLIGLAAGLPFGPGPGQASFVEADSLGLGGNPGDTALIVNDGLGGFIEVLALIQGVPVNNLDAADIIFLPYGLSRNQ